MKVKALVDTGATCSIMHPKIYEELALKYKLPDKIDNTSTLKSADGKTIQTEGTICVSVAIGQKIYKQKFVLADVEVPMVIGFDFLYENKGQIDLSGSSIILGGEVVPSVLEEKAPAVYKIRLTENTTILPANETIVKGTVEDHDLNFTVGMIELANDFLA